MGTASRIRPGQAKTSGYNSSKGSLKDGLNEYDLNNSHTQNHRSRPTRSSASTSVTPLANTSKKQHIGPSLGSSIANLSPTAPRGSRHRDSTSSSEDIAAEIVVWTEPMNDTMSLDSDSSSSPLSDVATPTPESVETVGAVEKEPEPIKSSEPIEYVLPTVLHFELLVIVIFVFSWLQFSFLISRFILNKMIANLRYPGSQILSPTYISNLIQQKTMLSKPKLWMLSRWKRHMW